jgi:hypothetical protein
MALAELPGFVGTGGDVVYILAVPENGIRF